MIHASYKPLKNTSAPCTPKEASLAAKGYLNAWQDAKLVAAQTLGLELRWNKLETLTVTYRDNSAVGDIDGYVTPAGPNHYFIKTHQRIKLPSGFQGLILPHPSFFDPAPKYGFNDVPAVVPILLDLDKNDEITLLIRTPMYGSGEHVFYEDYPICQLVAVPRGDIAVRPMTEEEVAACTA